MITFAHSRVKLGARAHKHAAMMDGGSCARGVNVIHGSFVGISPARIHMNVRTLSAPYFRNALFCQHISLLCQMDSTSGTSRATKPTTLFECQQQERSREHSTHCLQSVTAGGSRFKEVCLYPDTPPRSHTQMPNASDSISFVYARSHVRFE